MTNGVLFEVNMLVREHIRKCPDILVIFGDNLERAGYGGQARECRDEPNCLGIVVKRRPSKDIGAYFTDDDVGEIGTMIEEGFARAIAHLKEGKHVAYPSRGIATGYALLEVTSPKLMSCVHDGERALWHVAHAVYNTRNLYDVWQELDRPKDS